MVELALQQLLQGGLTLPSEGFVVRREEDEESGDVPDNELLERCWRLAEASPRDDRALEEAFWTAWRICRPKALRVALSEEEAAQLCIMANSTLGPAMQSYIDRLEKGGEAIGWSFKAGAEDGRPFRVERPLASSARVIRWRAAHPSGLGGMFTSGLGLVEKCAERGQALFIDWSGRGLLYRGYCERGNVWDEFFMQPAAAMLGHEALEDALTRGDVSDFLGTPCMTTPKVGLPAWHAAKGRLLCQRFAWLRPELRRVAQEFAEREMPGAVINGSGNDPAPSSAVGCRWLAVHLRRSDKGDEAPENLALEEEEIARQAAITCHAWGCGGVYLASDDWRLKLGLRPRLEEEGLRVAAYAPVLSPDPRRCTHMDQELDAHRKTWDACFEIAVMALCQGLLCTHSFMANMAVYYSRPPYPYRSFWDPLPTVACDGALPSVVLGLWEGVE